MLIIFLSFRKVVAGVAAMALFAVVASTSSCVKNPFAAAGPATPEAFCASLPNIGTGNLFFCPSSQGNLQGGLPNGWLGMCEVPDRSFNGLVGYSGYTSNGGRFPVSSSQSEADQNCGATVTTFGICSGVTRCTRQ
jgi:hypothetical protein